MATKEKFYRMLHDNSEYVLSSETCISERLCWFIRNLPPESAPLPQLLRNYSLAVRGDSYEKDENGKWIVSENLYVTEAEIFAAMFGLRFDIDKRAYTPDPNAAPFFHPHNLIRELISRWTKDCVIWCERAGYKATPLVEYLKSATNPAVFIGALQEIIVISDEPDRPGDVIVRIYRQF